MGKNFVLQKFEISSGFPTTPLFLAEDMSIWNLNTKCNIFKNMFFNEVRAIQAWNSCWFDKIHNIYVAQSWIYSTCTYDAVQSSCCCWICLGTLRVRTFITSFLSFFLSFKSKSWCTSAKRKNNRVGDRFHPLEFWEKDVDATPVDKLLKIWQSKSRKLYLHDETVLGFYLWCLVESWKVRKELESKF